MSNDTEKYLQIIADIERAYKSTVKAKLDEHKLSKPYRMDIKVFWFGLMGPSILALLIVPIGLIESLRWVFYVSSGLIGVSYLVLFVYPLLKLWMNRHSFKRLIAAPFANLVEANVKTIMQIDADYLPHLTALPRETLKLGALELKSERGSFEKRTYLVTGALEKLGIFPGIIALFAGCVAINKVLTEAGITASPQHWGFVVAAASIFYIMCGYVQMICVRYDRVIALTELALECKKDALEAERKATHPGT